MEHFIKHVSDIIDPPILTYPISTFPVSLFKSNEEQKILVLEPDVIVNDLETLEANDQLLVTTMSNLIRIEKNLDII